MHYQTRYTSPIGPLTLTSDGEFVTGVSFGDAGDICSCPVLQKAAAWLDSYFRGKKPDLAAIPLKPKGTAFQQAVWAILAAIPYGKTATYGEIARQLGEKMSAQAVGQAVGKNPIAILLPCHRVLGAKDKITGFSGGLEKKRFLLQLEHIPYRD